MSVSSSPYTYPRVHVHTCVQTLIYCMYCTYVHINPLHMRNTYNNVLSKFHSILLTMLFYVTTVYIIVSSTASSVDTARCNHILKTDGVKSMQALISIVLFCILLVLVWSMTCSCIIIVTFQNMVSLCYVIHG